MRNLFFLLLLISAASTAQQKLIVRCDGRTTAAPNPLYVIDGVVTSSSEFRKLSPERISSITILKDSSALALCGSRGKDGVIIVETKRHPAKDKRFQTKKNIQKDIR